MPFFYQKQNIKKNLQWFYVINYPNFCKNYWICSQLDAQLADMDSHREKALAAVAKGNSVLQDAANTLRTLKGKYRT